MAELDDPIICTRQAGKQRRGAIRAAVAQPRRLCLYYYCRGELPMRYFLLILVLLVIPLAAAADDQQPIRVAVLPFSTPKDKPDMEIYGAGTMDSLIRGLKSLPRFDLVDRG